MAHQPIDAVGAVLRPTDSRDLVTLRALFDDPGFHEQWGGRPLADEEILDKYTGRRAPSVECFIVEVNGVPVGFTQYCRQEGGDEGGGIDLVLSPDVRGRGLGSAVVHALVDHLRGYCGWRRITVDPDVANPRGVNFWRSVGFQDEQLVESDPQREPYWLMEWPTTNEVIEP